MPCYTVWRCTMLSSFHPSESLVNVHNEERQIILDSKTCQLQNAQGRSSALRPVEQFICHLKQGESRSAQYITSCNTMLWNAYWYSITKTSWKSTTSIWMTQEWSIQMFLCSWSMRDEVSCCHVFGNIDQLPSVAADIITIAWLIRKLLTIRL
jgi:hypothetical protein